MTKIQLYKAVDKLLVCIIWISVMTCLVRTDHSFAFAMFSYNLWLIKDDVTNTHTVLLILIVKLLVLLVISELFDLIFVYSISSIWSTVIRGNDSWNDKHGLRAFVLFLCCVNMILKFATIISMYLYQKIQIQERQTQQELLDPKKQHQLGFKHGNIY